MGLSPENQIEIEWIGPDKSIEELVKALEQVEKHKSEMKLGLIKRTNAIAQYESTLEFVSWKPISGYSQEDVDRIINSVTKKITIYKLIFQELLKKFKLIFWKLH